LPLEDYNNFTNPGVTLDEKCGNFIRYWNSVENTTYSKSLKIIIKDLFGIEELSIDNIKRISDLMQENNNPGYYKSILKDKCNIKNTILDMDNITFIGDYRNFSRIDKSLFSPVMKFEEIINLNSLKGLEKIEKDEGVDVHNLEDIEYILEKRFDYFKKNGAVGVKLQIAYFRTLAVDNSNRSDAEYSFKKLLKNRTDIMLREEYEPFGVGFEELKPYQDFILFKILHMAEKEGLPVQVHTGILGGNGNYLPNSNPELLIPLFTEFSNINFDVFHMGYPYSRNLIAIAKMFSNVYVDFSWIHILSTKAATDLLEESIQTLPVVKIFGFGADYCMVEGTYAHLKIAKENIANALTELILKEEISRDRALSYAEKILNSNVLNIFSF